ncbi:MULTISPECIES: HAD family hydrolase [Halomonadaceae]|uniref:KdsC family phosphatase n=1 Tax=Halomonadaceae TaxID=28256 RepID=UPI0015986176|nr:MULTISPECIES: HAD hydrolase family protein [Halomonas]QJQ96438.1 HAD hydrolase family protein [Halomonas sp. PA5]
MTITAPSLPPNLIQQARQVRLLALDVDGIFTDGRLYFVEDGSEIKAFHTQDGLGIKLLGQAGLSIALVTGRDSPIVSRRAAALGIEHVKQGRDDKLEVLRELTQELGLDFSQVAYAGDDLTDLSAIKRAGLGISVPNAPAYVREHADWVTTQTGGHGAVREICDVLLQAQGHWGAVVDTYLHGKR